MDGTDQLFAKVALKNKLVTEDQIKECSGSGPLGKSLLEKGYLSEKQHAAIAKYVQDKLGVAEKGNGDGEKTAPLPAVGDDSSKIPAAAAPSAPATAGGGLPPIVELLKRAKKSGASDFHLSVAAKPFMRLHGEIRFLEDLPVVKPEMSKQRIYEILTPELRERFEKRLDLDTCLEVPGLGRFRTAVVQQRRGIAGVFRIIREKIPTLEELGMPEILRKFTTYHQGIVLVTGATGSGKSSTLAALIEIVNQTRKDHVITLEDPIEYVYDCKKANISQRQIEAHTLSWANALRASLREDPDVIMVGEMRDLDTMRLAVTAAETGHLVLATLHTTNATRTIDRLLDVFPPKEQAQIRAMVSESLRGIVSQQLVPRADGKGRVAACEILFSTPAVANLIRERKSFQLFSVLQTGKKLGMKLMDDSLAELVDQKLITREQARFRAQNPRRFAEQKAEAGRKVRSE
jgi:twitching motility protein PilT